MSLPPVVRCYSPACATPWAACPPEADPPPEDYCVQRTAMMPKLRRTRTKERAYRVATERRQNREARMARTGPAPSNDDPPPF